MITMTKASDVNTENEDIFGEVAHLGGVSKIMNSVVPYSETELEVKELLKAELSCLLKSKSFLGDVSHEAIAKNDSSVTFSPVVADAVYEKVSDIMRCSGVSKLRNEDLLDDFIETMKSSISFITISEPIPKASLSDGLGQCDGSVLIERASKNVPARTMAKMSIFANKFIDTGFIPSLESTNSIRPSM